VVVRTGDGWLGMKLSKLLKRLNDHLNMEKQQEHDRDEGLCKVLKKLKKKELKLHKKIEAEMDEDERRLLEQELQIVHSQREKGIRILSGMRGKAGHKHKGK